MAMDEHVIGRCGSLEPLKPEMADAEHSACGIASLGGRKNAKNNMGFKIWSIVWRCSLFAFRSRTKKSDQQLSCRSTNVCVCAANHQNINDSTNSYQNNWALANPCVSPRSSNYLVPRWISTKPISEGSITVANNDCSWMDYDNK